MLIYRYIKSNVLEKTLERGFRFSPAARYWTIEGPERDEYDSMTPQDIDKQRIAFLGRYNRFLKKKNLEPIIIQTANKKAQNIFISCWSSVYSKQLQDKYCDQKTTIILRAKSKWLFEKINLYLQDCTSLNKLFVHSANILYLPIYLNSKIDDIDPVKQFDDYMKIKKNTGVYSRNSRDHCKNCRLPAVLAPVFIKSVKYQEEKEFRFCVSNYGTSVGKNVIYVKIEYLDGVKIFTNNVSEIKRMVKNNSMGCEVEDLTEINNV